MNGVKTLDAMMTNIMGMLENVQNVDVAKLRTEYQAEHANEIAAHKKHMSDMWAVCRIFEK